MRIRIEPGRASGSVKAPPSKSLAHRALICSALSDKPCTVGNTGECEDVRATRDCIAAIKDKGSVDCILRCRESASTMRFLIPAALVLRGNAVIRGSERLLERGIGLYEELFSLNGVAVSRVAGEIRITGTLKAGSYTLRGDVSSQYASGLLMALPLLEGDSVITLLPPVESRAYIDMTVRIMSDFGVEVRERFGGVFCIPGGQKYAGREYVAEGDWSNAAFLYALNLAGGSVRVEGLNKGSLQGDRVCLALFEKIKAGQSVDISQCPDLGPVLMSVCAMCGGGSITGTRRLKLKESDRAAAMAQELGKFGVKVIAGENLVTVSPSRLQRPVEVLRSYNDHRIAMALSVLAACTGAEIEGAEAVSKSFPDFFDALNSLGISCVKLEA